jgi:hypothetical protein
MGPILCNSWLHLLIKQLYWRCMPCMHRLWVHANSGGLILTPALAAWPCKRAELVKVLPHLPMIKNKFKVRALPCARCLQHRPCIIAAINQSKTRKETNIIIIFLLLCHKYNCLHDPYPINLYAQNKNLRYDELVSLWKACTLILRSHSKSSKYVLGSTITKQIAQALLKVEYKPHVYELKIANRCALYLVSG